MMEAHERSHLYGFFSRVFVRELDDDAVELVLGPLGQELLPELAKSEEVEVLVDRERRVAVHDADFVHLTVVNVVPYASFYLRDDGMVASGSANPVAEFLRDFGFDVDLGAARSLSPDHIGIVLEAMSRLAEAEAEAEARPDPEYARTIRDIERTFLARYVLGWVPIYFFAVERAARTGLYREAARVATAFIAVDHEELLEVDR